MNWSARDAEGADIGDGWGRNAGRRHRDQPRQPVGGAQALGDAIVPRHPIEAEAATYEAHDIEPRPALRQIERDIARAVCAVTERHADRAKRRESLGGEVDDLQFCRAHATAACTSSSSISTGLVKPNSRIEAAICAC
jgi:hypothetical protein